MKKPFQDILYYSLYKIAVLIFFMLMNFNVEGQDSAIAKKSNTLTDKKNYYRLTFSFGIGAGYPLQESDFGVAGAIEFALQKRTVLYTVGVRRLEEFEIIFIPNVINSVQSFDITCGKVFQQGSFYSSISTGIGWVTSVQRGEIIPGTASGFFDVGEYEKIVNHTIGVPVSANILWKRKKASRLIVPGGGVGMGFYLNINSKNIFYMLNLCLQVKI